MKYIPKIFSWKYNPNFHKVELIVTNSKIWVSGGTDSAKKWHSILLESGGRSYCSSI